MPKKTSNKSISVKKKKLKKTKLSKKNLNQKFKKKFQEILTKDPNRKIPFRIEAFTRIHEELTQKLKNSKRQLAIENGFEPGIIDISIKENSEIFTKAWKEVYLTIDEPNRQKSSYISGKLAKYSSFFQELPDPKDKKFFPKFLSEFKKMIKKPFERTFTLDNESETERYNRLSVGIDERHEEARKFLKDKHSRDEQRNFIINFFEKHPIRAKDNYLYISSEQLEKLKKDDENKHLHRKRLAEVAKQGQIEKDIISGTGLYGDNDIYKKNVFNNFKEGFEDVIENIINSSKREKSAFNIYNHIYWDGKEDYKNKRFSFQKERNDIFKMVLRDLKRFTKLKGSGLVNWFSECLENRNDSRCLSCYSGNGCKIPEKSGVACLNCIGWISIVSNNYLFSDLFPKGSHPQVNRYICKWDNTTIGRRNICGRETPKGIEFNSIFHMLGMARDGCHEIAKNGDVRSNRRHVN